MRGCCYIHVPVVFKVVTEDAEALLEVVVAGKEATDAREE